MTADRTLDLIDMELDRLRRHDVSDPAWFEWRLRHWKRGVEDARGIAAEKLQEIRDAYVADQLTAEAEDLGLYDERGGR